MAENALQLVPTKEQSVELFSNVPDVMLVGGVADELHVTKATIYREIQRGKLGCIHVGRALRVTKTQLLQYLEEAATNA